MCDPNNPPASVHFLADTDYRRAYAGTSTKSRTRNKPLRTYGKRNATPDPRNDAPPEQPLKKQRISNAKEATHRESSTSEKENALPLGRSATEPANTKPESTLDQEVQVKKGSILNFFKPLPQPSPAVSSPRADGLEAESTPPSSPPPTRAEARRKPRILKFRGGSLPLHLEDEQDDSERELDLHDSDKKEWADMSKSVGTTAKNEASGTGKTKKTKPKPSPTVQTTLNISSQAAFSECKVCDTVWNPLYPDDVKYHKKQHAAVLRRKRKLEDDEL